MTYRCQKKRRGGMTLVEIMLVLFIMMTIASVGLIAVMQQQKRANTNFAKTQLKTFDGWLKVYYVNVGMYPSSDEGLNALYEAPSSLPNPDAWTRVSDKPIPVDPWKNPYQYQYPGSKDAESYDISSWGPDGAPGTEDDIYADQE